MFSKKESWSIITAIILMTIIASLSGLIANWNSSALGFITKVLIFSAIIITTSIFAKKAAAYIRHIEIEHQILQLQRFGIYKRAHFKKPIPLGIIFPLLLSVISSGFVKCFTLLQFDSKALPTKVVKARGFYRYSEIMERDLAQISFWGLMAVLGIAILADLFTLPDLAKLSIYYSIWNLIPFGQLDGNKIFHGSAPLETNLMFIPPPLYFFSVILLVIAGLIVFI